MDKPLFKEGQRVLYTDDGENPTGSSGTVTKVIAKYSYEVEWDDQNPEWDIHEQHQLLEDSNGS